MLTVSLSNLKTKVMQVPAKLMPIQDQIFGMPFWISAPIIATCVTFWMELVCLGLMDSWRKLVILYALNILAEIVLDIKGWKIQIYSQNDA